METPLLLVCNLLFAFYSILVPSGCQHKIYTFFFFCEFAKKCLTTTWYHVKFLYKTEVNKKEIKEMAFTDSKEIEKKRLKIVAYINRYIAEHNLNSGEKIPSENTLAQMFDTNRNTVRSALVSLKIRGILYSQKGKGFFVAKKPESFVMNQNASLGLSEAMGSANLVYRNTLLDIEKRKPTEEEKNFLKLTDENMVFYLSQLRYVNNSPFALCYSTIPEKLVPALDEYLLANKDAFKGTNHIFSERYGLSHPICSNTMISSFPPGEKDVAALGILDNIPILQQENIYILDEQTPIEYFVVRGRSDMFKLSFNLKK